MKIKEKMDYYKIAEVRRCIPVADKDLLRL